VIDQSTKRGGHFYRSARLLLCWLQSLFKNLPSGPARHCGWIVHVELMAVRVIAVVIAIAEIEAQSVSQRILATCLEAPFGKFHLVERVAPVAVFNLYAGKGNQAVR